jgi:K+-sensing histidine kinase KdpD
MVQSKHQLPHAVPAIQRYGLALLCVAVALGGALLLERWHFRDVEVPLFLFAVAISAWYLGTGAAALALLLSCISFDYFFVEPVHTFNVSGSDLPYFIVFATFASLVTWFSAVRRRVERDLRGARDELKIEVAETHAAGQLAGPYARHDFRARHDRCHYLLEPWSSGTVRMDGGASDRQACARAFAYRVSGAD